MDNMKEYVMTEKNKIAKKLATMAVTGAAVIAGLTPQAEAGMMVVPKIPETTEQSTQEQKVEALSKAVDYAIAVVGRNGYLSKTSGEKVGRAILDNKDALNTPDANGQLPLFRVLNCKKHKVGAEQTSMETMAVLAKLMMGQGARLDATMTVPAEMDKAGEQTTVFDALLKTNPQMLKVLDAEMQKGIALRRVNSAGR